MSLLFVLQTVILAPAGIASASAAGSHTLSPGSVALVAPSIASGATAGAHTLTPGSVTISPAGLLHETQCGAHVLSAGAVALAVASITSTSAAGSHTLAAGYVTIAPSGLVSSNVFGSHTLEGEPTELSVLGIASTSALGTHRIRLTPRPFVTGGQPRPYNGTAEVTRVQLPAAGFALPGDFQPRPRAAEGTLVPRVQQRAIQTKATDLEAVSTLQPRPGTYVADVLQPQARPGVVEVVLVYRTAT